MVDSAKAAGVKLFIWSSAEYLKKVTNDRLSVFTFDVNGEITLYLIASGVPYILIPCGGYLSNTFGGPSAPTKQADGTYLLSLPVPAKGNVPMLDTAYDYGMWVRAAIESENVHPGDEVLTGDPTSFEDQMAALSECASAVSTCLSRPRSYKSKLIPSDGFQDTGKTFKYHEVKSKEEWITVKAAWQPFAGMFWDFWVFIAEYGCTGRFGFFSCAPTILTDLPTSSDYNGKDVDASNKAAGVTPPKFADIIRRHKPEEFLID